LRKYRLRWVGHVAGADKGFNWKNRKKRDHFLRSKPRQKDRIQVALKRKMMRRAGLDKFVS